MILNFILLFIASAIIFSLLIPKPKIEDAKAQEFSEDGFPKSTENAPIPYLLGKTRLESPNTLFAGNFRTEAITERVRTGLFSKKTIVKGYRYYLTLDLGYCLGDTDQGCTLHELVMDGVSVWSGSIRDDGGGYATGSINQSALFGGPENGGGWVGSFRFYPGTFTQPKDTYIDALPDSGGLLHPYRGVAHIVFQDAYIGESPQVRPIQAVCSRYTNRLNLVGGKEIINVGTPEETANWAEALYDVMVNQYGGLMADPNLLDPAEFIAVADVCVTEGMGVGGVIQAATTGEAIIKEFLSQADALLTIDPISNLAQPFLLRKDYNEMTLPVYGPSEIEEITKYSQTLWAELISEVKVGFKNPANEYQDTTAIAQDLAVATITGRLRSTSVSMPFVKDSSLANDIAGRELNQLAQIVTQVTFKANRSLYELRPGKVFKWTWPDYQISEMILRVKEVKEGDDNDPLITVDAVRDTYDNTNNPFANPPVSGAVPINPTPLAIAVAEYFGAPEFIVTQLATIAVADVDDPLIDYIHALPLAADTISVSVDGLQAGTDTMFSDAPFPGTGVLNTAIAEFDNFSDTLIPSIELLNVSDADILRLSTGSVADVRNGQHLIYINGEILGYSTFTNNGGGSVTLTNVYRALLNTRQQIHAINDRVYIIDGNTTSQSLTTGTVNFQLIPSSGAVKLDPLTLGNFTYTFSNAIAKPDAPDYTTVGGQRVVSPDPNDGSIITVAWRERDKSLGTVQIATDAADVEPANTVYSVAFYDMSGGGTLEKTDNNIVGATHDFTMPSGFAGNVVQIRVSAQRDGLNSIEYDPIQFTIAPPNQLLTSGDEQSGTDKILLSGDEQSGGDNINLSGDEA